MRQNKKNTVDFLYLDYPLSRTFLYVEKLPYTLNISTKYTLILFLYLESLYLELYVKQTFLSLSQAKVLVTL